MGQAQRQARLQEVVDRVAAQYTGADVEVTRTALTQAIADAGLPEQPEKWVGDAGAEIAAGRALVVDRHERRHQDEEPRTRPDEPSPDVDRSQDLGRAPGSGV